MHWEVTRVREDTVHFLAGQKRPKDNYEDTGVIPKFNKADMAWMMKAIKDYFRSHHGAVSFSCISY